MNVTATRRHCMTLVKLQCVTTHTVRHTEIPALLDGWVTNTPVKNVFTQTNCFSLYFLKNISCLRVGLLRIGQVLSVCCRTVYRWVTTKCYFMSDIHTYIHNTYIHTNVHTYIHTYVRTYIHTYVHTYIHAYIHIYIHKYIRTYIHTYIHIYIHT